MKGKIVIADASTLIGLLRIGQLSLLKKLFGEIIIPRDVYDEVVVERKKGYDIFKKSTYIAGFKVMGILGILIISKDKGFIASVKPFIKKLNRQGFRLSDKVIKRTLKETRE